MGIPCTDSPSCPADRKTSGLSPTSLRPGRSSRVAASVAALLCARTAGPGQQPLPHARGDTSPEPAPPALSPFPIAESVVSSRSPGSWNTQWGTGSLRPTARADTHLFASGDGHLLEFAVAISGIGADGQTWQERERTGQAAVPHTHHTRALTEHPRAPTATPSCAKTSHCALWSPRPCSPVAGSVSASRCLGLEGFVLWAKARSSAHPSLSCRSPSPAQAARPWPGQRKGPFSIHSLGTHASASPRSRQHGWSYVAHTHTGLGIRVLPDLSRRACRPGLLPTKISNCFQQTVYDSRTAVLG